MVIVVYSLASRTELRSWHGVQPLIGVSILAIKNPSKNHDMSSENPQMVCRLAFLTGNSGWV